MRYLTDSRCYVGLMVVAVLVFTLLGVSNTRAALSPHTYVETRHHQEHLVLVGRDLQASIYVDAGDYAGVLRTAGDLQTDIERVTGKKPALVHTTDALGAHTVLAGTLGHSDVIDRLAAEGKIDVDGIRNQWDAYHLEVVEAPLPGVARALVIVGSNRRGTSYGLYDLAEQIGVSPWHWWADVPPRQHEQLYVRGDTRIQEIPKVKYRGIFLNNEWPALTNWAHDKFDGYNHEMYVHVFELLLRLKGNFLWPTMWNNAFADDDPKNMTLAHEYGIVISTSHHEPMMRWDKEWDWYGEGPWSYSANADNLREFWKAGAERHKHYESIFTLGMRGQEDTAMAEGHDLELLETIVDDQRDILRQVFDDRPIEDVPQVWTLYKEVQDFYEDGMRVPDDVILLWANDNFGNVRRLPTPDERERAGGAGVYYHFDYVGGPRSYRWLNTMPQMKTWEQMNLAYRHQANKIWLVNVGDLKPMEYPIDFFLRMAWDPEYWDRETAAGFGRRWAKANFGEDYAEEIFQLITDYTRHNGRRKPEAQSAETYSLLNYREAERIYREMEDMIQRADALYQRMSEHQRDAYEQLVRHPVRASANVTQMYINQARNHLYAKQGRAYANDYGQAARENFNFDAYLEERFHTEISDGKWNHMMSQTRIGYNHWNHPVENTPPLIYDYAPHSSPDMGVEVEGTARAWPVPGPLALDEFSPYGQPERRITVYNRGTAPFDFTAEASEDWIQLSASQGTVESDVELQVSIDWDRAPEGHHRGSVFVEGTGWGGANIAVSLFKPNSELAGQVRGFVEADGHISIEAASFHRQESRSGYRFEEIENHGRTRSSISAFPISDRSTTDLSQAPYVEYDLFFFNTGEVTLYSHFAPTLNFQPDRGLAYGVGFAGKKPQVVDVLDDLSDAAWEISVLDNVRTAVSTHTIEQPGLHRLRHYRVDPGAVLQKIVIDTGNLKPSYLGPPESLRQ